MGYFKSYEDNLIIIHACDVCNKHLTITDKINKIDISFPLTKEQLLSLGIDMYKKEIVEIKEKKKNDTNKTN